MDLRLTTKFSNEELVLDTSILSSVLVKWLVYSEHAVVADKVKDGVMKEVVTMANISNLVERLIVLEKLETEAVNVFTEKRLDEMGDAVSGSLL